MQIGFEPKIVFLCPLCNKEVEMVHDKSEGWVSDHGGCVSFSVVRNPPAFGERKIRAPLVFIDLESDFSVKEAIEGLRALISDERDPSKRHKIEAGIRRLESKIGFADRKLESLMDAIKGGSYGLRIVSGRSVGALVWKADERFAGIAFGGGAEECEEGLLFSTSIEEVKSFILRWINYWSDQSYLLRKKETPERLN